MRPEEMIGQTLGHYRVIRSLGYGGSATIFLAEDIHLQREVAIKVFRPPTENAEDFLRRFAREARVLAQLDHPNILPVYEYGEDDTIAYLVMPHMGGGSLRDWLRGRGAIAPNETVQLISQVLSALQYAHERNLIHRDIKPGNMLFKADGTLMLSDFGLVKVLAGGDGNWSPLDESSANLSAQMLTGTPDYMAPEQINGKVVPVSDIYAMGVVLYEMLTGARLFQGDSYISVLLKHLHQQPRPLREINPQIPPELENVVLRALNKEPAQRYQRPINLRQALLQAIRKDSTMTEFSAIDTQTALNSAPSAQLSSTQTKETSRPSPPIYLQRTSSTSITPSAATHSDIHVSVPSTLPTNTPTIKPNPLPPNAPQRATPIPRPHSNKPLITALILIILVLTTSLGGVLYSRGTFKAQATPTPSSGTTTPRKLPVTGTPQVNKGGTTPNAGNTNTTLAVPQTQTGCPAPDQARAAVTARLMLGDRQNVIYIVNEGTHTNPTFGTIKRREANLNITAGVEISKMAQTSISEAQVSRDGQWVLFVANTGGSSQLRMVRVDGQGLQTLYCAPANTTITHSQWSFDQRTVVFNVESSIGTPTTYLLDTTTGNIQAELVPQSTLTYTPRTWLDNTHVYMTSLISNSGNTLQGLYLLDITKGANQHDGDLQKILPGLQACGSFDSSYDSLQLLVSACQLITPAATNPDSSIGPTTITSEPATGGTAQTLTTLPSEAVTMLRAVTPNTLLLLLENSSGDTTQNGLWKMNSDGTGLTQLSSDTYNRQSLCQFSQYAWSNVSRDNSMYALQEFDPANNIYNMYYGSMSGGSPYQFAGISGTQLLLAGWTSL